MIWPRFIIKLAGFAIKTTPEPRNLAKTKTRREKKPVERSGRLAHYVVENEVEAPQGVFDPAHRVEDGSNGENQWRSRRVEVDAAHVVAVKSW